MKELMIEEKARAYDEAIERAKNFIENGDKGERTIAESIFAGIMEESEDERIREALIHLVNSNKELSFGIDNYDGIKWGDILAWLEKQGEHNNFIDKIQVGDKVTRNEDGMLVNLSQLDRVAKKDEKQGGQKSIDDLTPQEAMDIAVAKCFEEGKQKPADKVEPKFHEGNWIVHHGTENIYQVVAVIDNQYQLKYGDTYTVQKCADVDRCARLWDINKDAKDGDVLFMDNGLSNCIFIYKSSNNGIINKYSSYNKFGFESEHYLVLNDGYVIPATKEQRDTLMKAMADAGYTFDFEEKVLKKIEQKPAWSEEDEKLFKLSLESLTELKDRFGKEYGKVSDCIVWLKSLRPQTTWKPNDEQMKALQWIIDGDNPENWRIALNNLYCDLKKLRKG